MLEFYRVYLFPHKDLGGVMRRMVLTCLLSIGLMTAVMGVWAADSPEAEHLSVWMVESATGDIGIHFEWDACNSKLEPGMAWVTWQNQVHVKSEIATTSAWGGMVTSQESWMVEDAEDLAKAIVCGTSPGAVQLKVRDAYGNVHQSAIPFSEIDVLPSRTADALRGTLCQPASAAQYDPQLSYLEVPGTEAIADIDAFLAMCPPEDELAVLQADFPILTWPPARTQDPEYTCWGSIAHTRTITDALTIYQALRVIRHMKLSEPLPWTFLHPYDWLKTRIGAIVVSQNADVNMCCSYVDVPGSPVPVAAMTLQKADDNVLSARTVWRDPQEGMGLANLILLIFHEARHADLPHDCGTNDSSPGYMGAWGVQVEIAQRLADGRIDVGLDGEVDAGFMAAAAQQILQTRFCEP